MERGLYQAGCHAGAIKVPSQSRRGADARGLLPEPSALPLAAAGESLGGRSPGPERAAGRRIFVETYTRRPLKVTGKRFSYVMSKLTKRDIVVAISNQTGMVQHEVFEVVQRTLDHITDSLAKNVAVELRNFGVFQPRLTKPRVGRNPNEPGSSFVIPPRSARSSSRPGKIMRQRVEKAVAGAERGVGQEGGGEAGAPARRELRSFVRI